MGSPIHSFVDPLLARLGVDLKSSHLLLAVSGGRDSMCMLAYFASQSVKQLSVASVHHGLRGVEADADLALVAEACKRYHVAYYPIYLQSQELQGSGSFEALARVARYRELQTLRERIGADYLCTAHHQQDQVETLLLRMMRGTGLFGLRGILPLREDCVLRPFLEVPFSALNDFAEETSIVWREDPTNTSDLYARNRVRHRLLPHLRSTNSGLEEQILRIATHSSRVLEKIHALTPEGVAKGSELHRLWLATHGTLLDSRKMALHCTPKARKVQVGGQTAVLDRPEGSILWGSNMYLLTWQFRDREGLGERPTPSSGVMWIDADLLLGVPVLRSRLEGDRFAPPGIRSKHRKLKKYLQEKRIESYDRDALPLVAVQSEVLWVGGFAVSGNFQVQANTKTVLELRLNRCHRTTP